MLGMGASSLSKWVAIGLLLASPLCMAMKTLPTPVAPPPPRALSNEVQARLANSLVSQAAELEHGEGVDKDLDQAIKLYCDAARFGNSEAMYSLGWIYANGRGVERNEAYAGTLFAMAAEKGYEMTPGAQRFMGQVSGDKPDCLDPVKVLAAARAKGTAMPGAEVDIDPLAEAGDLDAYIAKLPADKQNTAQLIRMLAPQYKIHPRLALAFAVAESNLNISARSPKGAQGIMQLMPDTATRFGVTKAYDPGQNIRGGLAYIRWLLAYYQGDVLLAASGYNAGEGAVDRNHGIPPFVETVAYVKRILNFYKLPSHPYVEGLVAPSPILKKTSVAKK